MIDKIVYATIWREKIVRTAISSTTSARINTNASNNLYRPRYLRINNSNSSNNKVVGIKPSNFPSSQCNCYYSTATRYLKRSQIDKPLSYLDRLQNEANKLTKNVTDSTLNVMASSKSRAKETAWNASKKASSTIQETTKKATESVQQIASTTLENTQQIARTTTDKAIRRVSETAYNVKEETTKRLCDTASGLTTASGNVLSGAIDGTRQKLSKTATDATKATSETISQSTEVVSRSVDNVIESNVRRPIKNVTNIVTESSREIVDNLTSSGTKLLRWIGWWSLGAVFVYGIATTLPMAIIKYTLEQKKEKHTVEREVDTTTSSTSTSSRGSLNNNNKNDNGVGEKPQQQQEFSVVAWNALSYLFGQPPKQQ